MNVLKNKIEVNLSSENFCAFILKLLQTQIHDLEDELLGHHPRLVSLGISSGFFNKIIFIFFDQFH